jgi:hypothetical protein
MEAAYFSETSVYLFLYRVMIKKSLIFTSDIVCKKVKLSCYRAEQAHGGPVG